MAHLLAPKWNAVFWRGAIAIAFAIVAFAWPIVTLTGLVLLFGFFALIDGALALAISMRSLHEVPKPRWSWALLLEGLTGIAAGALAVFVPGVAIGVLITLIALWALATGLLELFAAASLHRDGSTTTALVAGGGVSIAFAVVLVAWPSIGAAAIAWVLGAYAMVFGVVLVALAARLRRLSHHHHGGDHHGGHRGGPMVFGGGAS